MATLILCASGWVGPQSKESCLEACLGGPIFRRQPEKKMPSLLDHLLKRQEPDTTGEVDP